MNTQTNSKTLIVSKDQGSITDAVCRVGIGVVFAFAVIVGIISFISIGSGILTAILAL